MATAARKKKVKHLKFETVGGKATVHFGNQHVTITIVVPRKRLTERLLGPEWRYLDQMGIPRPRSF